MMAWKSDAGCSSMASILRRPLPVPVNSLERSSFSSVVTASKAKRPVRRSSSGTDTCRGAGFGGRKRDCSRVSAGSCYAGGFIPYSLQHDGPFYVRNHIGGDFEAKIFPGSIEHARGLAAERVVTNPISSADRDLLQDYQRRELRGRPLDGVFTLRVWEEPGVNFAAIEDVQLVLKYRYWTRFE